MRRVKKSLLILILAVLHICTCALTASAQKPPASSRMTKEEARVLALTEAAWRGNLSAVKTLLAQGVSLNAEQRGHHGWTALMAASTSGQAEVVNFLLAKGADPKVKLEDGSTTLYQAAQNGDREVVEALIAAGVELNAQTKEGRTALIRAAWMSHTEALKRLIAAGAEVNARGSKGESALLLAVNSGHGEIVKALLVRGADIQAIKNMDRTLFLYTAGEGEKSRVSLSRLLRSYKSKVVSFNAQRQR